jgi:hypothetical protein
MRREGVVPWDWVADHTRWMRKPRSYTSLEQALAETAQLYRRNVWREQAAYVEVWLEKDALAGVLYAITEAWDVPLMVSRGYASLSYLYEAAQAIRQQGKPACGRRCSRSWNPAKRPIPPARTYGGWPVRSTCRWTIWPACTTAIHTGAQGQGCVFHAKAATDSTGSLPPIPRQSCHQFHTKVATHSMAKLPLIPGESCH